MENLYSDSWYIEEIKKINLISSSNKSVNPEFINQSIKEILELEFRSPIEIFKNDFCNETMLFLEKSPLSLGSAFNRFNKNLYQEISFDSFLSILRNFESYRNHLVLSYLFLCKDFFMDDSLLIFNEFKESDKIAILLKIKNDDYNRFCDYMESLTKI